MTDLIIRLSKLDAPDREVDAELEAVSLGGRVYLNDPEGKEVIIERPIDGFWIRGIYPYRKIARYTASVDAVIARADREIPGWEYILRRNFAELRHPSNPKLDVRGHAFNTATAACIALLRAKEASHDQV